MTQNGAAGGTAGSADLDGGPVTLYSSVLTSKDPTALCPLLGGSTLR